MRKFLFVLASTASLATVNVAIAQYDATGSYAPGYYVPGYYNPRFYGSGYSWRRERAAEEWRQWQNPETQKKANNALSGQIGLGDPNAVGGECAKGFSEETCRRRGQKYNGPR
jgi:hypothetical protein